MPEKRYTVGEISRITGVSKDTLRYYDKIGLFKPVQVDPHNNYRYYSYDQFWSLDIITCCRRLDISTEKIREILSSRDNELVLRLLHEQKKTAMQRSQFFRQIAEDIDWYSNQQERISRARPGNAVTVRSFPQRAVLYGENAEETHAYHLKLQQLCANAVGQNASIRRCYGFVLDHKWISQNRFVKKGEYLQFDEAVLDEVDPSLLTILPAGTYACCVVRVNHEIADFSPLTDWLAAHSAKISYVIADEIGLQLYHYLDNGYLCEIKVLLT